MIITITLNPSMDSIYFTEKFIIGEMNRCNNPVKAVGGKGINAGRTAAILGSEVYTTGVLAGENGRLIDSYLKNEPFHRRFIYSSGETRNAVTVMDAAFNQTEIVELGPEITKETAEKVLENVCTLIKQSATPPVIALCGSANTSNEKLYADYLAELYSTMGKNAKILTDISGKKLEQVLKSPHLPFFIKPNLQEFSELIGQRVSSKEEVKKYIQLLEDIPFVLVSCGSDGAIAKYNKQIYDLSIPKIHVVNPTGSGDATVGGIAFALDQGYSIEEVLCYGMACGVSNAMEQAVGFVTPENVQKIKQHIKISKC